MLIWGANGYIKNTNVSVCMRIG